MQPLTTIPPVAGLVFVIIADFACHFGVISFIQLGVVRVVCAATWAGEYFVMTFDQFRQGQALMAGLCALVSLAAGGATKWAAVPLLPPWRQLMQRRASRSAGSRSPERVVSGP